VILSRPLRWAVPFAVVAVVGAGAQLTSRAAAAEPDLPAISARDLLVKVQNADVRALTGTVRSTTSLGLPALPQQGGVDWSSLLAGTRTLRVYVDGPARQRVDLLGDLTQASVVHDGRTLWTWSSTTREVTHAVLPSRDSFAGSPSGGVPSTPGDGSLIAALTPQQAAERALSAVSPTTRVSVGRAAVVAGRPAYDLRLEPRQSTSLVGTVQIYVDARTGLVLRTVVVPRSGGDPAVDIGYTRLSLRAAPASTFRFAPPPGATVRELSLPAQHGDRVKGQRAAPDVQVLGSGWASAVEVHLPAGTSTATPGAAGRTGPSALAALERAATPVHGQHVSGRMISTRLVSVLQTTDGRLYVGAVTPSELVRLADAR
jgi:outer membrane lipoprotein-sorting protein